MKRVVLWWGLLLAGGYLLFNLMIVRRQNNALRLQVASLERQDVLTRWQNKKLANALEEKQRHLTYFKSGIKAQAQQLKQTRDKISSLEREKDALLQQYASLKKETEELRNSLERISLENKLLSEENNALAQKFNSIKELKNRIVQIKRNKRLARKRIISEQNLLKRLSADNTLFLEGEHNRGYVIKDGVCLLGAKRKRIKIIPQEIGIPKEDATNIPADIR